MSEHAVHVDWQRTTDDFAYETYTRNHCWTFVEKGITVPASAAPAFLGEGGHVDPEEALVASLSSCHMLTFLVVAAKKRFVVDRYTDDAVGVLAKNDEGRWAVTRVALRPQIVFGGDVQPTSEQIEDMHRLAHEQCFIANSVRTEVVVETTQGAS